ncbi:hypothetical protein ACQJBY_053601 [Aegilops geniculata]
MPAGSGELRPRATRPQAPPLPPPSRSVPQGLHPCPRLGFRAPPCCCCRVPRSAAGQRAEPNLEAYMCFLVDSKLIFQMPENIVDRTAVPCYVGHTTLLSLSAKHVPSWPASGCFSRPRNRNAPAPGDLGISIDRPMVTLRPPQQALPRPTTSIPLRQS